MNCDEVAALLGAEVDGEIDALRSHALRKHAAGCAVCGPRLESSIASQRRVRRELPYHLAPPALRSRLAADMRSQGPVQSASPVRRWYWFGGGVLAGGMAAGLVWVASAVWVQAGFGEDLPTRLVGLHTRATLGNHLIEVASSDRHTVKPWISARLDYTIPVVDASGAGFALMGARVDRLDGKPVAVLVYRHRLHVVDVFVRPAVGGASDGGFMVRGFNVAMAHGAAMQWLATSDLNAAELGSFVTALAQGRLAPAGD